MIARWLVTVMAAATLLASGTASAVTPTVLAKTKGPVWAFAQDGARLVWSSGNSCARLRTMVMTDQRPRVLGTEANDPAHNDACELEWIELAVAGKRALWGGTLDCCNNGYGEISTAVPGGHQRLIGEFTQDYHYYGDFLAVAGDGSTLVYAITTIDSVTDIEPCYSSSEGCCFLDESVPPCVLQLASGVVYKLVRGRPVEVPGVPPVALLAVSDGRIAVVPADPSPSETQTPRPTATVEIRTAASTLTTTDGALVTTFFPTATPQAVALTEGIAAVLVRDQNEARIEWYDAASGQALGDLAVSSTAAPELSLAGSHLVYRDGKVIHAVDLDSACDSTVAVAAATPIGLSIEGLRIAWAENPHDRGAIKAIDFPAQDAPCSTTTATTPRAGKLRLRH